MHRFGQYTCYTENKIGNFVVDISVTNGRDSYVVSDKWNTYKVRFVADTTAAV